MIIDTDKIEWLLENRTQYYIRQKIGISQGNLSHIVRKESSIENLTVKNAFKLTQLAIEEQKNTQD